jgi:hypothetical protein
MGTLDGKVPAIGGAKGSLGLAGLHYWPLLSLLLKVVVTPALIRLGLTIRAVRRTGDRPLS